jgi:hypothetical protein
VAQLIPKASIAPWAIGFQVAEPNGQVTLAAVLLNQLGNAVPAGPATPLALDAEHVELALDVGEDDEVASHVRLANARNMQKNTMERSDSVSQRNSLISLNHALTTS